MQLSTRERGPSPSKARLPVSVRETMNTMSNSGKSPGDIQTDYCNSVYGGRVAR